MSHSRLPTLAVAFLALTGAALACALPGSGPTPDTSVLQTAVAATLTAVAPAPSDTPAAPPTTEAPAASPTPTSPPASPTPLPPAATNTPPPGGVSLNCDGTYQRVRITNGGASGKTISVDNWNGSSWVNVWNIAGGDPMIRQIEDEAGYYPFGACQKLIIVPLRYTGSGAVLELTIHKWTGSAMKQVYYKDGVHGRWRKVGDTIIFEESLYLYGEPNCCPCNTQTLEHTWDGSAFVQTGSLVSPTYSGTPPPICTP